MDAAPLLPAEGRRLATPRVESLCRDCRATSPAAFAGRALGTSRGRGQHRRFQRAFELCWRRSSSGRGSRCESLAFQGTGAFRDLQLRGGGMGHEEGRGIPAAHCRAGRPSVTRMGGSMRPRASHPHVSKQRSFRHGCVHCRNHAASSRAAIRGRESSRATAARRDSEFRKTSRSSASTTTLVECELTAPALSSVAIPWREMGRAVALLVRQGLEGVLPPEPSLVRPTHVVERRSSDIFAVNEPLVAAAVAWIHQHSNEQLRVDDVVRAVKTYRQRLEKRFRAVLGRTVMDEVRRSRVERAKRLLAMTDLSLPDVALRSGYTSASLLSVAFRRETRTTPGAFRRRARGREPVE